MYMCRIMISISSTKMLLKKKCSITDCKSRFPSNTCTHIHPFLPSSPKECVSVPLSPVGIIYHYIQQTEVPQLLCPGDACSHAAIKAKRHPLPPAPMGAREWRGKESRGRGGREEQLGEGRRQGDREEKRETRIWNLWDWVESVMERVEGYAKERHWQQILLPHMGSLGSTVTEARKEKRRERTEQNRWRQ